MKDYLSRKAKRIAPYTAGAQPKAKNIIKLNTNENPYPPSPAVLASLASFDGASLRRYPRPDGGALRTAAARSTACQKTMCFAATDRTRCWRLRLRRSLTARSCFPTSHTASTPVWAAMFDIPYTLLPLSDDFSIPVRQLKANGIVLANPNAPTGMALPLSDIETVLQQNSDSVVIVDEAYAAFGAGSADTLIDRYPNLLVVKTLSKSHSLAGMRIGYALGQPHLIDGLERIKDSFNSYPLDRHRTGVGQRGAA